MYLSKKQIEALDIATEAMSNIISTSCEIEEYDKIVEVINILSSMKIKDREQKFNRKIKH